MISQAADSCQLSSRASSPLWSVSGFWLFFCQAALLSTNLNLDEVFGLWQFFPLKTPRTHQQVPAAPSLWWLLQVEQNKSPISFALQPAPAPQAADSDTPAPHFSWDFGSSTAFLRGTRSLCSSHVLQAPLLRELQQHEQLQLHRVKRDLKMNQLFSLNSILGERQFLKLSDLNSKITCGNPICSGTFAFLANPAVSRAGAAR